MDHHALYSEIAQTDGTSNAPEPKSGISILKTDPRDKYRRRVQKWARSGTGPDASRGIGFAVAVA
jgi:hypothetical protein